MKKLVLALLFVSSTAWGQTQISGSQIKDGAITNPKVATNAAIGWAKINWTAFDPALINAAPIFTVTSPITYTSNVVGLGVVPLTLGGTGQITAAASLAALGGVPATTTISTTSPLNGGGALSGNLTLGINTFVGNTAGAVPTNAASNKTELFFRGDGTWAYTNANTITNPITTKIANYTALVTDYVILVDATAGPLTITLPAVPRGGQQYYIKKIDSTGNTVTILRGGSSLIDGVTQRVISFQWTTYHIQYDGTNWFIL